MPYISVIAACYNTEALLPRCVKSILEQNFTDYELILVDDGSTDGSGRIADGFCRDNVKVIHKENGGAASARAAGLQAACGEYVWFVDSDDAIEPGALKDLAEALKMTKPDIARFGYKCYENGTYQAITVPYPDGLYCGEAMTALTHRVIADSCLKRFTEWMHAFRREMILKIPMPSEREVFAEDMVFCNLTYLYAASVYVYNEYLYQYHRRPDSLSNRKQPILGMYMRGYTFLKEQMVRMGVWELYKTDLGATCLFGSILGAGLKDGGCAVREYMYNADRQDAHAVVSKAIHSEEVAEMLSNTENLRLPPILSELRSIVQRGDENELYHCLGKLAIM